MRGAANLRFKRLSHVDLPHTPVAVSSGNQRQSPGRGKPFRQSRHEGNRSEFGEEFGEGSLEPLTRAAERGSAELTVEASRRSPTKSAASLHG